MKVNLLAIAVALICTFVAQAQDRSCDPVVVEGSEVSCMLGKSPSRIVGFRYNSSTGWKQIPVQIDELVLKDVSAPYGGSICGGSPDSDNPWDILYYADPTSHVGPDNNQSFDSNDELVFMAMDAGDKAAAGVNNPAGVVGNRCELSIFDPVENRTHGYIYLFEHNGSLNPNAGEDYVNYDFVFFPNGGSSSPSDNVKQNYVMCYEEQPLNTENSRVVTADYESHFAARWTEDELILKTTNTNKSVLDIHQITLDVQKCLRYTTSFSNNRGVIVSTIDGPVRAIRSVMGTNSGRYNQLTIFFTKCQAYYRNDFRVHDGINANISQAYDMLDFTNAMNGTFYSNQYNTNPVTVNGNQDNLDNSRVPAWALYEGTPGSIVISASVVPSSNIQVVDNVQQIGTTKVQLASDAYYDDRGSSTTYKCEGDGEAIGTSGWVFYSNGCFDKRYDTPKCNTPAFVGELILNRTNYYLPSGVNNAAAAKYSDYVNKPLTVTVGGGGSNPTCSDGVQNGNETGVDCGGSNCPACPTQPTCSDGIQNGNETGVDCGGLNCAPCNTGGNCAAPTGLNTSSIKRNKATLDWNDVNGASSYTINLRAVGTTAWDSRTSTKSRIVARSLMPNTTYEWRVKATCGGEESEWSTIATFTTASSNRLGSNDETLEKRSEELILDWKAIAYPSPTADFVIVEANELIEHFEIIDLTGRILQIGRNVNATQIQIDVQQLKAGAYFIRLHAAEDIQMLRFVKQ